METKYRYAFINLDVPLYNADVEQMKKILDKTNPEWWGKVDRFDHDWYGSFRFRFDRAVLNDDHIQAKINDWWNSDHVQQSQYATELVETVLDNLNL